MKNHFLHCYLFFGLFLCSGILFSCATLNADDKYSNQKVEANKLCEAAKKNEIQMIKDYIAKGNKINIKNDKGEALLHCAAKGGNIEIVKILVKNGADLNARNRWGYLPSDCAWQSGNNEIARFLIDKGFNQQVEGNKMCEAAEKNEIQMVKDYIAKGNKINITNVKDQTLLHCAARGGNIEIVKILVENGAVLNARDQQDAIPLEYAIGSGDIEIVKILLKDAADINSTAHRDGESPLIWAARSGRTKMIRFLLDKGADINGKSGWDQTPLMYAAKSKSLAAVHMLLERGADPKAKDINSGTALHQVLYGDDSERITKLLLDYGADANAQDALNITPLHLAAARNSSKSAQVLIEYGAELDSRIENNTKLDVYNFYDRFFDDRDQNGFTPLLGAVYYHGLETCKVLIDAGCNLNVTDNKGRTPLMIAIERCFFNGAELLVKAGCDLNLSDAKGQTALMYAAKARQNWTDIVKLLIKLGCDVNARNNIGRNALSYCRYTAIGKLLIDSGSSLKKRAESDEICHREGYLCNHINFIQTILGNMGYDIGQVDGFWGPQTSEAIKKFQIDNDLPATGEIDVVTEWNIERYGSKSPPGMISNKIIREGLEKAKKIVDEADMRERK